MNDLSSDEPLGLPGRNALGRLLRAIDVYREGCPSTSTLTLQAFLLVATRGPIGPTEIARSLQVASPVVSGGLDILESGGRGTMKAPGLVTRIGDTRDARQRLAAVTPRGAQLLVKMRDALKGRVG